MKKSIIQQREVEEILVEVKTRRKNLNLWRAAHINFRGIKGVDLFHMDRQNYLWEGF